MNNTLKNAVSNTVSNVDNNSSTEIDQEIKNSLALILKDELPELSSNEWRIILDTYRGVNNDLDKKHYVVSDICMDKNITRINRINDSHEPGLKELLNKIIKMSQAQQTSIIYFNNKFWSGKWDDCETYDEIIEKISSGPLVA